MDFRNEYRIWPSGCLAIPWALHFRKWWWVGRWSHLSTHESEEAAYAAAKCHAGVGKKSLGRLP